MENLKTIKKYHLFKYLEDQEIVALLRCFRARCVTFKAGSQIISRGEKIEFLYIILDGNIRDINIDIQGNILTHFDYKAGDIIGTEYISLGRKTFINDYKATADTAVLLVDSFRFVTPCNNFCPRHTKVLQKVIQMISKTNHKLHNRIKEITMPTTKEKILLYLNNIKKETKTNEFNIPLNREELASYLGVERSALSKELSNLSKEGKIAYHKNHFILF